ncbi:TPA: PTS transporter subunit EIIC [Staphylococcus aureus]|nr:PTS transporter subunit EIIC [Staphylococcus aureus]
MKSLFEKAQQFGKSFMLPIAILPAAGLLLGIGGALSNPNTVKAYPILDITLLQNIFTLMSAAGSIVFQNLPVIFAIGVAIGLSRSDKGTAGLAALLGFLIMNATMNGLLTITGTLAKDQLAQNGQGMVLGIQTVETGVFGFILRLLGPLGLHHIFYLPFWQTALGGTLEVKGHLVQGTQNIFFAQLGDPDVTKYYSGVSRFMSGRFITMMFGLCGAALAIYHTAKPEHKKVVGGLMLSAALTSFLTGITEPLEFSFLFVAPILYVIHAFFDGLAFMMADIFNITIGQTFSGGFIDFLLFGVLQGNSKTNYLYVIPIGIVSFCLYYIVFRFLITKFNFKTPGREDKAAAQQVEATERAQTIVAGLGGQDNIEIVDCCATRLRVTLHQNDKVDKVLLESTGAKGVIQQGTGVQVIYGPHVTVIKNEIEELLGD